MHFINYLKEQLSLSKDDTIDLIDYDGSLKEMPNQNNKDFALQFLNPTGNYVPIKIEIDLNTNEKRYLPLINEQKMTNSMTSRTDFFNFF
jgi:hypothetical protein